MSLENDDTKTLADSNDLISILLRFESLGDNCEFGFVQRHHGIDPGGLFRWSTTSLSSLIKLFDTEFSDLYKFENLVPNPTTSDMVYDTGSGIGFHSKMHSKNGQFLLDDEARQLIYNEERGKVDHLISKLRSRWIDPKTFFIFKATWGAKLEEIETFLRILRQKSDCKLLIVDQAIDGYQAGTVQDKGHGLLMGKMPKFAPWSSVNSSHISLDVWEQLIMSVAEYL